MFSVYGSTGRVFQGTLEQMRLVRQVHAADRIKPMKPTARDGHDSAVREALDQGVPLPPAAHRPAIAAYAAAQQHSASHGWFDMAVSEVMTRPVLTLTVETGLYEAGQRLSHHGRGQAPVVNTDGILVGLLTRADLSIAGQGPKPGASEPVWEAWRAQGIETVMQTPVPSVSPAADLRRAATALLDSGLPGLPVVDDEGRVIGFISRSDVLRAALRDAGLDVWS
jgi:CBS domain-containing protein